MGCATASPPVRCRTAEAHSAAVAVGTAVAEEEAVDALLSKQYSKADPAAEVVVLVGEAEVVVVADC